MYRNLTERRARLPKEEMTLFVEIKEYGEYGSLKSCTNDLIHNIQKAETNLALLAVSEYVGKPLEGNYVPMLSRFYSYADIHRYAVYFDEMNMGIMERTFSATQVKIRFSPSNGSKFKFMNHAPKFKMNSKYLRLWYSQTKTTLI